MDVVVGHRQVHYLESWVKVLDVPLAMQLRISKKSDDLLLFNFHPTIITREYFEAIEVLIRENLANFPLNVLFAHGPVQVLIDPQDELLFELENQIVKVVVVIVFRLTFCSWDHDVIFFVVVPAQLSEDNIDPGTSMSVRIELRIQEREGVESSAHALYRGVFQATSFVDHDALNYRRDARVRL